MSYSDHTSAGATPQSSFGTLTLAGVLDDLAARFIVNLPPDELESMDRVCFQIEQAYVSLSALPGLGFGGGGERDEQRRGGKGHLRAGLGTCSGAESAGASLPGEVLERPACVGLASIQTGEVAVQPPPPSCGVVTPNTATTATRGHGDHIRALCRHLRCDSTSVPPRREGLSQNRPRCSETPPPACRQQKTKKKPQPETLTDSHLDVTARRHWYYEDFIRPNASNPSALPSYNLKAFSLLMFKSCPLLHDLVPQHARIWTSFMQYKERVPVCGAVLINEWWDKVSRRFVLGNGIDTPGSEH